MTARNNTYGADPSLITGATQNAFLKRLDFLFLKINSQDIQKTAWQP